jgi:hypothetical protein
MTDWPVVTTEAGVSWDAVRIPLDASDALYRRLVDLDARHRLGPIVASARSQVAYWLIPTGASATWPPSCRLLTRGSSLVMPTDTRDPSCARWLHYPDEPDRLTGAAWLAKALAVYLALEAAQ